MKNHSKRIAILAHSLRVAGGLSVGINLIREIYRIVPHHHYQIYIPSDCEYEEKSFPSDRLHEARVVSPMSSFKRLFFEWRTLPREINAFHPDWVIGLGNVGLRNPPNKQAILFQDSHLVYPQKHYASEIWSYKNRKRAVKLSLAASLNQTEVVFAQTQTTRSRFAETFRFPIDRIHLLPNAVSAYATSQASSSTPSVLTQYQDRFKFLVLTKCYGHKNLDKILDVYVRYRDELKDTACIWTISPDQHPIAPKLLNRIKQENLEDLIVNVGPLKQDELPGYFQSCHALLMPTLLESFSSTYLESMHYHRPILTSDLDFAHDVCGDAALFVDPWKIEDIKQGMIALRDNEGLRTRLVQAGDERIQTFFRSWQDITRDALGVLELIPK